MYDTYILPSQQAASPLPQVSLNAPGARGGPPIQTTTSSESLTTPVLSLATPNIFSSLPPIFSNLMGDFPFGQTPGASAGAASSGPGGGGGDNPSAALVAFPVSIQPSAGSSGAGNLILQAQNMGQPFLLTPTYDTRQNPLNTQGLTPPTSLPTGFSPNIKDFEQLKQQYERTQQLIQQQLLLSQMIQQQQQHQQGSGSGRDGGVGGEEGGHHAHQSTVAIPTTSEHAKLSVSVAGGPRHDVDSGLGSQDSEGENQYINGADVMMSSQLHSDSLLSRSRKRGPGGGTGDRGGDSGGELDSETLSAAKRPRLDTPPGHVSTI